ncbi:MAG: tRNA 2-thiouridine(34) synthase MnmA [Alphaproteobacteria bacterium]|nr:tRNA 2-thiouridine(34) synthase MnmA [Alphaproteobacteria bacterium]
MKVAVGLSGGVDSTLVALMLKNQGCDVVGISMSFYNSDLPENEKQLTKACYGRYEKQDIKDIHTWCLGQGIEHYTFDISEEFKKTVLAYFKQTYLSGATPNPCVFCNTYVKFGLLLDKAKQAGIMFDKFATGHYARIVEKNGVCALARGVDEKKDQSYFLYRLTPEQLSHIVFPLGELTKEQVRDMAHHAGLIQADKQDSQDFYNGDYVDLLDKVPEQGDIILTNGQVLGKHNGFWNYTIGQRKGLGIAYPEPLYVVALDSEHNAVVVGTGEALFSDKCVLTDCVWHHGFPMGQVMIKYRSTGQLVSGRLEIQDNQTVILFDEPQRALTPGQSAVVYQDDIVLGGGIICK